MTELKGYLLTEEEEKACETLVKELRKRKTFAVDFSGYIRVKAKTRAEANDLFWEWVEDIQNKTSADWSAVVTQTPCFEGECAEEE